MKLKIDGNDLVAEFQTERNWFGVTTAVITIPLADIESLLAVHKMQLPAVGPHEVNEPMTQKIDYGRRGDRRMTAAPSDETSDE